jgi:hypothetical protein
MVQIHGIDRQTKTQQLFYAVVYIPKRSRDRFQASCIQLCQDKEDALLKANIDKKWFPAQIYGPSKSSEGLIMYYLNQWLIEPNN